MRPIIINNFLHPARILADGCEKLRMYSVEGTQVNEPKVAEGVEAGVGAAGALGEDGFAGDAVEGLGEGSLHGGEAWLDLPAVEGGAVVAEGELPVHGLGARCHWRQYHHHSRAWCGLADGWTGAGGRGTPLPCTFFAKSQIVRLGVYFRYRGAVDWELF